jgi:hypothetical protein
MDKESFIGKTNTKHLLTSRKIMEQAFALLLNIVATLGSHAVFYGIT